MTLLYYQKIESSFKLVFLQCILVSHGAILDKAGWKCDKWSNTTFTRGVPLQIKTHNKYSCGEVVISSLQSSCSDHQ